MAAGRTPKQLLGDNKKRKAQNMGKAMLPKPAGATPDLEALRAWVPKGKAKAITAKAKKVAANKLK
jgi:hypothetical protein